MDSIMEKDTLSQITGNTKAASARELKKERDGKKISTKVSIREIFLMINLMDKGNWRLPITFIKECLNVVNRMEEASREPINMNI